MIKKVGVVGAGVMGHGIAELVAISGYKVLISDVNDEILGKALEKIRWSLERLEKKKVVDEKAQDIISRIEVTTDLADFSSVDLVIEAVKEKTEVKRQVFQKLSASVKKEVILSSNTSTIPITELSRMAGATENFIGIHFSNPPVMMPIVEIIMADGTSNETLKATEEFVQGLKKEFVVVKKDIPGFLINRLNDRAILEAMTILEDGYSVKVLDAMTRFRLSFPMGMCELLDFVGIDTVYNANREMVKRGFNSRESTILKEKFDNDLLGSKTGEGFYHYGSLGTYSRPQISPDEDMFTLDPLRLLAPAINEAAWLVRNEVCGADDVEKAMKLAMNWPYGPLEYADRFGIDNVVRVLRERWAKSNESRYSPDPLLIDLLDKGKLGVLSGEGFLKWGTSRKSYGPVDMTVADKFALIEINRPERLNSLDEPTWKGLKEALDDAAGITSVRSVVLTGRGRAFCAGDDIAMMEKWEGSDAKLWMNSFADPLIEVLSNYPKPLISAVNGLAFGGGCELNILFDIVIAVESATFSIPEGLIGAMPPIASALGYGMINRKFARYALTGEWFSSREAKTMGLVDIIVPDGSLYSAIVEFTDKVSKIAPLSASSIKSTINIVRSDLKSHARYASESLVTLSGTRDFKEGQKAFLAKGKPEWEGR